jgi:hypothetical protein
MRIELNRLQDEAELNGVNRTKHCCNSYERGVLLPLPKPASILALGL